MSVVTHSLRRDSTFHCPPLAQARKIQNQGVLKVGVPLMQDLQKWAEQSQSSEDYKQLSLGTFEAAPRWLAKRKVNVKWTPLSLHQVIRNAKAQFVCECGR